MLLHRSAFRFCGRKLLLAAGLAGFSILAGSSSALAFTEKECTVISLVAADVVKAVGAKNLSVEFRESFVRWMNPPAYTCDGPKDILTPKGKDIDAFNTIMSVLESGKTPIFLQEAGLRSVDPKSLKRTR